jgi:hypothetical protein
MGTPENSRTVVTDAKLAGVLGTLRMYILGGKEDESVCFWKPYRPEIRFAITAPTIAMKKLRRFPTRKYVFEISLFSASSS